MEIAGAMRELCKRAGLSQKGLAQKAGYKTVTAVSAPIARGDLKLSTLIRIANTAGYDVMLVRRHALTAEEPIILEPTEKHEES